MTAKDEIWKDIEGYEGLYQVSSFGRIKSLPKQIQYRNQFTEKEIILKPTLNRCGYFYISLCNKQGKKKMEQYQYLEHCIVKIVCFGICSQKKENMNVMNLMGSMTKNMIFYLNITLLV